MKKIVTYLIIAIGLFSVKMQASTASGSVELKKDHPFPPIHNGPKPAPIIPTPNVVIPFQVNLSDGIMYICSDYPVTNITVSVYDDRGNVVLEDTDCGMGDSPYLIDLSFLNIGIYSVVISDQRNNYIGSFSVGNDI